MISIINKVDLKPLNEELYARPKPPSYLIMSQQTFNAIKQELIFVPHGLSEKPGDYCVYRGIPIATCNAVPFGYIDIKD